MPEREYDETQALRRYVLLNCGNLCHAAVPQYPTEEWVERYLPSNIHSLYRDWQERNNKHLDEFFKEMPPNMVATPAHIEKPPELQAAMEQAWRQCREEGIDRVLTDFRVQVHINRCPRCNRIARYSTAEQCPWCFHHWHGDGPNLVPLQK